MQYKKKLANNYLILVFIALLACVQSQQRQRPCRFNNNNCIVFPNQIPVWSPVPSTTPLQRPQQLTQPVQWYPQQQYPTQQPNQMPEHQSTMKANAAAQESHYDSDVATNASLSVLNFAQTLSRLFQRESISGEQIFSPLSIFSVMQLLLAGSNGKTYDELNRLLSYNSDMGSVSFQEEFGKLIEDLVTEDETLVRQRSDAEWKLTGKDNNNALETAPKSLENRKQKIKVANGIFVQSGYNLRPAYQSVIQNVYRSEIVPLDFNQSESSVTMINNWVSEKTYGKIPTIIDRSGFKQDTTLIMICALYFKAFWESPFIKGATMINDFYPDGARMPSIKVNMMANGGVFPYYEDPVYQIKVIGFPYKDGKTTMYIFQPFDSTREKLRQMQDILNPEMIEFMISQMKKKTAVFAFPRLHITNAFNLNTILQRLGLKTLFAKDQSDLSLISEQNSYQLPQQLLTTPRPSAFNRQQYPTRRPDIIFLNRIGESESETNSTTTNGTMEQTTKVSGESTTAAPSTSESVNRRKRKVTYKVESDTKRNQQPLRLKDLVINKRITKLSKEKKVSRSKRDSYSKQSPNQFLLYLDMLRNSHGLNRPDLFVEDIIHKVDLVVNEEGTEGAAATVTYLRRSGTDVSFRAETPFLMLLRHDTTKLPLFYGAVFEPTFY